MSPELQPLPLGSETLGAAAEGAETLGALASGSETLSPFHAVAALFTFPGPLTFPGPTTYPGLYQNPDNPTTLSPAGEVTETLTPLTES